MREEPSTAKKLSSRHQKWDLRGKDAKGNTISLNVHGMRDPVLFTMESGMKWNNLRDKNNL